MQLATDPIQDNQTRTMDNQSLLVQLHAAEYVVIKLKNMGIHVQRIVIIKNVISIKVLYSKGCKKLKSEVKVTVNDGAGRHHQMVASYHGCQINWNQKGANS